jgi:hypothetical protein
MKADRSSEMLPLKSLPLNERGALRDKLLEVLEEVGQAKGEGRYETLNDWLTWLHAQADEAEGWPLALIEVALQAAETLAGTSLPPEEMALRTFVERGGEVALGLLERLARFEVVAQTERQTLPAEDLPLWEKLEELGVVILAAGGFALNRRSHALARDLVEPPVLKAWRHVQECRGQMASATPALEDGAAARFMEVKIGLTPGQARAHLRRYPLAPTATTTTGFRRPPWKRESAPTQTPSPNTSPPPMEPLDDPFSSQDSSNPAQETYTKITPYHRSAYDPFSSPTIH